MSSVKVSKAVTLDCRYEKTSPAFQELVPLPFSPADVNAARGTRFLGSRYPVIGGAMSWLSLSGLVAAVSNAGGFGVLASGCLQPTELETEIRRTRDLTDQPFGVNVIVFHEQVEELVATACRLKISHVTLAGSVPRQATIRRLKDAGCKVMCFAPGLRWARRLAAMDADAIIVEGSEAGGHVGAVSTGVLTQEILPHFHDLPVFVAGGICRGEAMASYLAMGAAGVQVGTLLVCAKESVAHPRFKAAVIRADAREALTSVQIDQRLPVIPVRALRNAASEQFVALQRDLLATAEIGSLPWQEARMKVERFWAGALRRAVVDGDVEAGSVMIGQGVGMVREEAPVGHVIAELVAQAQGALRRYDPRHSAV